MLCQGLTACRKYIDKDVHLQINHIRTTMLNDSSNVKNYEGQIWIQNPTVYIQQYAPKLFGRMPDMAMSQLSLDPPLFECRMTASEEKKVVGIGQATSRKNAERKASLDLCRMIDEVNQSQVLLMKTMASRALKTLPEDANKEPWFSNPRQYFVTMFPLSVPQISVFPFGSQFLTQVTGRVVEGLGLAASKKESLRLAFIDACMCDASRSRSLLCPTPLTVTGGESPKRRDVPVSCGNEPTGSKTRFINPRDYLTEDIEEFRNCGWYSRPKDYLYSWSMKRFRQGPKYESKCLNHNGRLEFTCTATLPCSLSPQGLGRAPSIKEASRLASISLLAQQNGSAQVTLGGKPMSMDPVVAPCIAPEEVVGIDVVHSASINSHQLPSSNHISKENTPPDASILESSCRNSRSLGPLEATLSKSRVKKMKLEVPINPAMSKVPSLGMIAVTDRIRFLEDAFRKLDIPIPVIQNVKVKRGHWKASYSIQNGCLQWADSHTAKDPQDAIDMVVYLMFCKMTRRFPDLACAFIDETTKSNMSRAFSDETTKSNLPRVTSCPAVQYKQAELVAPASQIEFIASPSTVYDGNGPHVELNVEINESDSIFSWLHEDKNIGRLWQTVKEVQSSVEYFTLNPVAESDFDQDLIHASISTQSLEYNSLKLLREAVKWKESPMGRASMSCRQRLPAFRQFGKVLDALSMNQVIVVSGPAGSGKSTQLPNCVLEQIICDGYGAQCNILVTEPRRIAALALAHRVAEERGEPVGARVGYQIRFDNRSPESLGGITYCTTGILLNKLRLNPRLYGYSHIFIDEAHERDLLSDFSLILIRDLLMARPELRLVVMSASMDVIPFVQYFSQVSCALVKIDTPPMSVKTLFLEDMLPVLDSRLLTAQDASSFINEEAKLAELQPVVPSLSLDSMPTVSSSLLEAVIGEICIRTPTDESILVFLPGWEEISALKHCLLREDVLRIGYSDQQRFTIYTIHSQIKPFEQRAMFEMPPHGTRKIILATNIAESSITINDVVHVVDSAKVKVSFYKSEIKLRDLSCEWISRANSIQRCGRAGRTRGEGVYYCLMSRCRHESLEATPIPEIMRADLQEACLLIKSLGLPGSIEDVLSKALDAPETIRIRKAVQHLQDISALTKDEALTPLGHLLIKLPLSPSVSKMVIYGMLLRCIEPIITIAASMTIGSPFMSKKASGEQLIGTKADPRTVFGPRSHESDQLAVVVAFNEWHRERANMKSINDEADFAMKRGLSPSILARINQLKQQLLAILHDSGLLHSYHKVFEPLHSSVASNRGNVLLILNENSQNPSIVKAALLMGLLPQLAVCTPKTHRRLQTQFKETIMIHPSSVNYVKGNISAKTMAQATMVVAFQEKFKTRAALPHALSTLHCEPLTLFLLASSVDSTAINLGKTSRSDLSRVIQTDLSLPKTLSWISYMPNCSVDGLKMFKVAVDASFSYLTSRLCLASSANRVVASDRFRNHGPLERAQHSAEMKKFADLTWADRSQSKEFADREILSFVDKVVCTVVSFIDSS